MGLLDVMDDPRSMGLLSLGLRLMSTPGKFGTALGQAGMGAMGDLQAARQIEEQRKVREQQMALVAAQTAETQAQADARRVAAQREVGAQQWLAAQNPNQGPVQPMSLAGGLAAGVPPAVLQALMQESELARQRANEDAFRRQIPNPQVAAARAALASGGGPTIANAERMQKVDPQQQMLYNAMMLGQIKPMEYLTAITKDDAPIKLGEGETLLSGKASGYKPLATGQPKASDTPTAIREYQFAVGQGYKGSFQQFQTEQKKAGATNVSVSMDKGFGDAFAKDAASMLAASRDQAQSAASNLRTLNRIDETLATGKVAVGPTAKFETWGRQLGQTLGVGGKDNAEVLGNTRKIIQGAASLAADGAKLLAGQGQITEGERALIAKASGADIDNMTPPEIQALSAVLRKVNSFKIQQHDAALKNVGPQFAPFVPFYKVQMPEAPAVDFGSLK